MLKLINKKFILLVVFILILIMYSSSSQAEASIFDSISNIADAIANKFLSLIIDFVTLLGGDIIIDRFISSVNSIPNSVKHLFGVFQIGFGITVVLGAYLARFILRRIPFIG